MKNNIMIAKQLIKIAKSLTNQQEQELFNAIYEKRLNSVERSQAIQYFILKGGEDLCELFDFGHLFSEEEEYVFNKLLTDKAIDSYYFMNLLKQGEENIDRREKILNRLYNDKYAGEFIIEAIAYNYLTEQELLKWGRLIVNKLSKEELKNQLEYYINNKNYHYDYLLNFIIDLIK